MGAANQLASWVDGWMNAWVRGLASLIDKIKLGGSMIFLALEPGFFTCVISQFYAFCLFLPFFFFKALSSILFKPPFL